MDPKSIITVQIREHDTAELRAEVQEIIYLFILTYLSALVCIASNNVKTI